MGVVLRAADHPLGSRAECWREIIDDAVVPMDLRFDGGPDTRDELVVHDLGAVRLVESTTGPGQALRTRKHISRSGTDILQLFVHERGQVVGEQRGRESDMRPGDLSLVDMSQPFRCVHGTRRSIVVSFPTALLPLRRADLARVAGSRFAGDRGPAALVSALVRQLPRNADTTGDASRVRLGTTVLDLLGVVLAERLDSTSRLPDATRASALRAGIHAFVEARLAEPDLGPSTIAAAHHISVRYLHKLFEAERTTVAEWIRHRRLERSRAELLDPASARPVSAIAAGNGFVSPSHFSRLFREAYGVPPGEYRTVHGGAATRTAS
jgi:AraC-like DNA-binding protein